ncbi:MAG: S9 family peptidase [Psychromonas sp.]|nr:S9 family peptidase [Alteromonadales bacterium]MCP5078796.1 S9 family peptidase [Psychromonas sp.]
MKTYAIPLLITTAVLAGCSSKVTYIETAKKEVVDTYFSTPVTDPYRWLEDDLSDETAQWVSAENSTTYDYLDKISYRKDIEKRLQANWNYEKTSAPFKEGKYHYFYKNDGLQNQYVLYRQHDNNPAEIFLDPNQFSVDGTTSLSGVYFSKDGSRLAYIISEGGSDWKKIVVIDSESKQLLEEAPLDTKFSGVSWKGNEGFYYSTYDKPKGSELSAKTDQHKLYYHQLGTKQTNDEVIFGATAEQKYRYVSGWMTDDLRYLIISGANETSGNLLFLMDLNKPERGLITLDNEMQYDSYVIDNKEDQLYIVTNYNAPNKKLVTVSADKPQKHNWQDVIPETENVLSLSTGAGYLFAHYMVHATTQIEQYDYQGKILRHIDLPGTGSAYGFSGKEDDKALYYKFTNYNTPSTTFRLDPNTGESVVYKTSKAKFESSQYQSQQIFYRSKDGTKVPMIITHKKGIKLDGNNPTILYGYGGFNTSITPYFSPAMSVWMEQGGVYAVPNIRGGGEYGKEWHKGGIKMNKQNVFDDFIAAAEYLIDTGYTSSDYLAIRGGSNGGLLVGAVMTQRPDLMKVALPAVGVLDMLRYHTFTAGAGWAYDYGTAEDSKEMFEYLFNYSPVHNVKEGVHYPATLVTTGDHDDRVVPAHSYKFAAQLQAKQGGDLPVLIRIETDAGHGAGTPVSKTIAQYADIFSFTLFNMGVKALPQEIVEK